MDNIDDYPSYLAIAKKFIAPEPISTIIDDNNTLETIKPVVVQKLSVNKLSISGAHNKISAYYALRKIMMTKVLVTNENVFEYLRLRLLYEKGWTCNIRGFIAQSPDSPSYCRQCCTDSDMDMVEINGFCHSFSDFLTDRKFMSEVRRYYTRILGDCYVNIKKIKSRRPIKCLADQWGTVGLIEASMHGGEFIIISISPRRY